MAELTDIRVVSGDEERAQFQREWKIKIEEYTREREMQESQLQNRQQRELASISTSGDEEAIYQAKLRHFSERSELVARLDFQRESIRHDMNSAYERLLHKHNGGRVPQQAHQQQTPATLNPRASAAFPSLHLSPTPPPQLNSPRAEPSPFESQRQNVVSPLALSPNGGSGAGGYDGGMPVAGTWDDAALDDTDIASVAPTTLSMSSVMSLKRQSKIIKQKATAAVERKKFTRTPGELKQITETVEERAAREAAEARRKELERLAAEQKAKEEQDPFEKRVLYCLWQENPFRALIMSIVTNKWFDRLIICAIITNCVFLAMFDPFDTDPNSDRNKMLDASELVFQIIFTCEVVLKVIAYGFLLGPKTYLRDAWNKLDFAVVVLGFLSFFPSLAQSNLSGLRTIRVLRPLRTMTGIKGMRVLVQALIVSVAPLTNVVALMGMTMFVFGIIGIQVFGGALGNRCHNQWTGLPDLADREHDGGLCGGRATCPDGYYCDYWGVNMNWNITQFDSIWMSIITIFQALTLEGWTDIMYAVTDGAGTGFSVIYFILLQLFGSFFVLNLALGVLTSAFGDASETDREEQDAIALLQQEEHDEILRKEGRDPEEERRIEKEAEEAEAKAWRDAHPDDLDVEGNPNPVPPSQHPVVLQAFGIVHSNWFYSFVVFLIILNTIFLGMNYHNAPTALQDFLEIANIILSVLFFLEMVLKLLALYPRPYFKDPFNCLDAFVVMVSILELTQVFEGGGVTVLRALRLLRVLKLVRSWVSLQLLLSALAKATPQVAPLCLLLFLFMAIYSLLGMQLFGAKFEHGPDSNFDSFFNGMFTVFQFFTGENWNEVMYDGMRYTSFWSALFFLSLVIIGCFVLLNLFLAILLDGFSLDVESEDDESKEEKQTRREQLKAMSSKMTPNILKRSFSKLGLGKDAKDDGRASPVPTNIDVVDPSKDNIPGRKKKEDMSAADLGLLENGMPNATSLWLFPTDSSIRTMAFAITKNPKFDQVVMILIFVSSLMLMLETSFDPTESQQSSMDVVDQILTFLFIGEAAIKILSLGFILHKGAYLRDTWNDLDFFIVAISIVSLALGDSVDLTYLKSLRSLRALRPLRVIKRADGLRVVVNAIIRSVPSVCNVLVILMLVYYLFGVLGVELFGGTFLHCSDEAFETEEACEAAGELWKNPSFGHFDNIFAAILLLFEVSTLEGWLDPLEAAKAGTSDLAVAYFLLFIILGSFVALNLFTGVVVDNFNKIKAQEGSALMTEEQKAWVETQKKMLRFRPIRRPVPPHNPLRLKAFAIVMHPAFDPFIIFCILFNTGLMASRTFTQPDDWTTTLEVCNIMFTWIFFIEMVLKLVALGPPQYWDDAWNKFDCILVWASMVGFFLTIFVGSVQIGFLRIFRVLRILRLIKRAKGMLMLIRTLLFSLPSMANVGGLLFLLFFVYAVAGVNLFKAVRKADALDDHANFDDFWQAMLLLFRMSTGESWNSLMHNCMIQEPDCSEELGDCGNSGIAVFYFVSFQIFGGFVMLNLFIAIILENFETEDEQGLTPEQFDAFSLMWQKYDPNASCYIKWQMLPHFLRQLEAPLGLGNEDAPKRDVAKFILELGVKNHNGYVHYQELLSGICARLAEVDVDEMAATNPEMAKVQKQLYRQYPSMKLHDPEAVTAAEVWAATRLQAAFRGSKMRKMVEEEAHEANAAAEKLQAIFKGYRTRKLLKEENLIKNVVHEEYETIRRNSLNQNQQQ